MVTMLGCERMPADCASRNNRSRRRSRSLASVRSERRIVLIAITRPMAGSWARYTTPIAPRPISPSTWYRPIFSIVCFRRDYLRVAILAYRLERTGRALVLINTPKSDFLCNSKQRQNYWTGANEGRRTKAFTGIAGLFTLPYHRVKRAR